jgi:hypothetical protein
MCEKGCLSFLCIFLLSTLLSAHLCLGSVLSHILSCHVMLLVDMSLTFCLSKEELQYWEGGTTNSYREALRTKSVDKTRQSKARQDKTTQHN